MAAHVVATVAEIPEGGRKTAEIAGRRIVVFNLGGAFFALLDRCPHQGGPLSEGILCGLVEAETPGRYRYSRAGEFIRCPWHAWEFDVRTGRSQVDPRRIKTRAFPARVEAGAALVAETFPVRVEEDYVVVEA